MRGYGLLHCIGLSWNVRGVALADLGSFLEVLQHEFNWSFLCIQELTKAVAGAPKEVGGHRIFACPSKGGARVPAVVINSRWDDYIKDSIVTGSAVGVKLQLPFLGLVFIYI